MSKVMTDLRGYTAREPEQTTSKSKLLAAAAVILGIVAIGAYAYRSQGFLPSTPASQQAASHQPIALTPPAQPAMSGPDATPAPQWSPAVPSTASPEIAAPLPETAAKAKSSEHIAHVKPRTPATQPKKAPAVSPPDTTQVPAAPSQAVAPEVTAPSTESTSPYTAAPATTTPQTTVPDATTPQQQQTEQQTAPDQNAPQTPQ